MLGENTSTDKQFEAASANGGACCDGAGPIIATASAPTSHYRGEHPPRHRGRRRRTPRRRLVRLAMRASSAPAGVPRAVSIVIVSAMTLLLLGAVAPMTTLVGSSMAHQTDNSVEGDEEAHGRGTRGQQYHRRARRHQRKLARARVPSENGGDGDGGEVQQRHRQRRRDLRYWTGYQRDQIGRASSSAETQPKPKPPTPSSPPPPPQKQSRIVGGISMNRSHKRDYLGAIFQAQQIEDEELLKAALRARASGGDEKVSDEEVVIDEEYHFEDATLIVESDVADKDERLVLDLVLSVKCGSALVHPSVVMTAAHCAHVADYVRFFEHDLASQSENVETRRVVRRLVHPDYDDEIVNNDLCLLLLDKPSTAPLVRLNRDPAVPRTRERLTIMGWGTTAEGGNVSHVPLKARVDALSHEECVERYPREIITKDMMCAFAEGRDSCQGDSGGPLVRQGGKDKQGRKEPDTVVGVVSWGYGCAKGDYPGVYSCVSEQIDWIDGGIRNLTSTK